MYCDVSNRVDWRPLPDVDGRGMCRGGQSERDNKAAEESGYTLPLGCDRPPRWCDVHHIIFWTLGDRTDLTNGVLLCGFATI